MTPKRLIAIAPADAHVLMAHGALAVDVREPHEHNAEHIAGDVSEPLSALSGLVGEGKEAVVFYCNSGRRTSINTERLASTVRGKAYHLEGGLNAWKEAGLPVEGGDPAAVAGANSLSQMLATFKKG